MTARETLGAQEPVAADYGGHSAGSDDEDGKLDAVVYNDNQCVVSTKLLTTKKSPAVPTSQSQKRGYH